MNTIDELVLTARVQRLKERYFTYKPSIAFEGAKALTDVAKENPSAPAILQRARGMKRKCETIPISIYDDELIVGHPAGKPRAGVFSPEITCKWLEDELDTVHVRAQDPYEISDEAKRVFKEEIFPFWKGKTVEEKIHAEIDEFNLLDITIGSDILDCIVKTNSGGGDLSPGYGNILIKKGFSGIKLDAETRLAKCEVHKAEDIKKVHFYKAVIEVCEGMILFGERYAALAREMATTEYDPQRKQDLLKIARVCDHIPANPPTNFHEALQMTWFGQVSIYLEENVSGISPGRIDQYLYPYLKKDLDNEILSIEEAEELLCCFLLKFPEISWPLGEGGAKYFAGYMPFQNIAIGGITREGKDATNMLSYMVLECVKNLKLYQPSLSARIHNKTPQEFLLKIAEVVATGIGMPALHFDNTTIRMLLSRGISLEDSRDYCLMGCVEPYIHGKLSRWTSAMYTNFPVAIEFAFTNGYQLASGKKMGLDTGEISSFKSFEEFEAAVKKQLQYVIEVCAFVNITAQRSHRDLLPKPLASSLIEGCVESGKGLMQGGAVYDSGPGVVFVGTADYANSMAAVKKLVFEEKKFSLEELATALKNNFEGYEEIEKACLNAPKFGNDLDEVDDFATDIIDFTSRDLNEYDGLYSKMELGTLSITANVTQGLVTGALPSGRKAGIPLADGISPSQGTDVKGPTAAIRSVNKINQESTSVGTLFNMKLDPLMLSSERGRINFASMVRAHNQLGGSQIQFNVVDKETLLCAQEDPDSYKSLIVRVAGYSAFFTELAKDVQDDIINRSMHESWSL